MKISELIAVAQEIFDEHGDIDVISWDGERPRSFTPKAVVTNVITSDYGYTLPSSVYGMRGKKPRIGAVLTDSYGFRSI